MCVMASNKIRDEKGEPAMGMLRVISKRGDDRVQWNEQDAQAGDSLAMAAIREAERIAGTRARQGRDGFPCRSREAERANRAV
jgi:hypothetical protein